MLLGHRDKPGDDDQIEMFSRTPPQANRAGDKSTAEAKKQEEEGSRIKQLLIYGLGAAELRRRVAAALARTEPEA